MSGETQDPHMAAVGMFTEVEHPTAGLADAEVDALARLRAIVTP